MTTPVRPKEPARPRRSAKRARRGRPRSATQSFERALSDGPANRCVLRLYVAGATERSRRAILRVREICKIEFHGDVELEVIDVYQHPILARDGQIVATPTLVRVVPLPLRRMIGSLENTAGLFVGLHLDSRGRKAR